MSIEASPSKLQYSFEGKRVLITGGGRGVGRALLSRLYHDGAKVFTLEKDPELVSQLLKDFPDKSRLTAQVCDISNWNETQSLIHSFGPIDHLVNSAVTVKIVNLMDIKEEDVEAGLGVNLKSQFCTSQSVAKMMIQEGTKGTIVNISSVAGHIATKGAGVYCVSKAGVQMLTKCLATELGQHGIRVNSVSPGAMMTPLLQEMQKMHSEIVDGKESPLARQPYKEKLIMEMDDIVNAVMFVLSPLSSIMTGADLVVDGGILAC